MRSAPDVEQRIRRVVSLANSAPSAENCQPWSFVWDGRALWVWHDAERARHAANRDGHLSLLALGGLLQAIEIAANAEGMGAESELTLDEPTQTSSACTRAWAHVRLEPGGVSDAQRESAAHEVLALRGRATDRGLYRRGSLDHDVFRTLTTQARHYDDCQLHVLAKPPRALLDYLLAADGYLLHHPEVLADVLRWLRFDERELQSSRDGMLWRSLGFDLPWLSGVGWLRELRTWRRLTALGLPRATGAWLRLQLWSSAALCAISVRPGSRPALVSAGRLMLSTWTALNRAGFGVQPMTVPSLMVHDRVTGSLPHSTNPEFRELFHAGRALFAKTFDYDAERVPVWLIRTGRAAPLPAQRRTPRLPASALLRFE